MPRADPHLNTPQANPNPNPNPNASPNANANANLNSSPTAIVVMGVAGSGKTTIGRLIAERMGVPFADADDFHTEQARLAMAAGRALTDADRDPWLHRLADWLAEHPDGVLACSALKRSYRDALRAGAPEAFMLHLAGSSDVATGRVGTRQGHYMPVSLVASQYETLEPLGWDEAGMVIDFTEDPAAIVERILGARG
ncbi:MAG: gluconokinase/dehydrogenase fusion protein [Frankiales bacterium]|nr:gluconokinase/dehydrogenase fusion protein [Frankiales bacterium]